ncbi:glycosyltransferase [Aureliella helgolandensis]|uniref:2-deoxystreptamine N-acetyl-D-glucosaminyltransferase n=1 Tax=Aureliella helgolandensis TaxID=2527968 RepID=A0A518GDS1_9BACT|nr:glycosyltransferase [Aureliella helgolandensis]QDV26700.1 2-deoxystreptamine N-acetyl-D-glucosaminyltransferase [Aureliella helgolandensis]
MRIALTITELDPGGAEACLVNLACYLKHHQHEVQVFSLGPPPQSTKLTERLAAARVPWQCGGLTHVSQVRAARGWLRERLVAFSPEIIQSMLFHANAVTAWAARGMPCKVVGGVRVRQPQRYRWWIQSWAARAMERVVCVSQDVAEHCQRNEGIPPSKIVVIPNGIHLPTLPIPTPTNLWESFGIPPTARVLLFVGRLDPQKGIESLVARADALLGQLPEHHLVLLGDGPLRERITQQTAQLACRNRVHPVGWQPDPFPWMQQSEAILLPAKYEGMPNAILEAMAVGKPVVSFAVDGVRQLLGQDSLAQHQLVDSPSIDAFILQVVRLAQNPDMQQQCGTANHSRIEQHFQLDQQLAKYEQLYLALI